MQIRCQNCHKPFGLNKDIVRTALDHIVAEHLSHYDAACPHCRRVNRVSKEELQRAAPDWQAQSSERSPNG